MTSQTPRATPRSMSRIGSLAPSSTRAGSTLRRLPPRNQKAHTPARVQAPVSRCPNPDCASPDVQEIDGQQTCINCGATVPDSNIVSEVTFGESSTGAAVVQGGFVGEGQRHAKTLGPAFRRGAMSDSREHTEGTGREEIRKIGNFLNIAGDVVVEMACRYYKMAVANRFIIGRRVRTVAAVCLYVACRRQGGESTVLLIDFAEAIKVNVFRLGEVYQDMRSQLFIGDDGQGSRTVHAMPMIEVEELIHRYAMKLEFGDKTQRVATDAAKIIRRMKRDWIVTGRQPSGLCGACIILAARMNNFRRTIREVVYVVKAADLTIGKRLEEFKRTDSSALSVEQFREHSHRLKKQHDPPVLYERRMKQLKKRKLQMMYDGPRGNPDQVDDSPSNSHVKSRPSKKLRRDAEGFAIPPKPVAIDPALADPTQGSLSELDVLDNSARTPSRSPSPGPFRNSAKARKARKATMSRQKKPTAMERPEMRILTDEDFADEESLIQEIGSTIEDKDILEHFNDVKFNHFADKARKDADEVRTAERERKRQEIERKRQQTGLVIELDDEDDSDAVSDADQNEQQPFDRRAQPRPRMQPALSSTATNASPGRGAAPPSRVDTPGLLTPAATQSQSQQHRLQERSLTAEQPAMSGALDPMLATPPATQTQADDTSQATKESPKLLTVAPVSKSESQSFAQGKKKRPLGRWDISSDPEISPSEFDDDPEVKYCRLTEADVKIKEVIWVTDNEDWLRDQQRKQLRRAIIEAQKPKRQRSSSVTSNVHDQDGDQTRGGRRRGRKRGKMGDGAVVKEGGAPKDAAEAAQRMIEKRGKGFSRYINKGALDAHLKSIYSARKPGSTTASSGGTGTAGQGSRAESEVPSNASAAPDREYSVAESEPPVPTTEGASDGESAGCEEGQNQTMEKTKDGNGRAEANDEEALSDGGGVENEDEADDEAEEDGLGDLADEYGDDDPDMRYDEDDEVGFDGDEDFN